MAGRGTPAPPGGDPGKPSLFDLPRIPKRARPAPESSDTSSWGGGVEQLAPARRQRGQWAPPRASGQPSHLSNVGSRSRGVTTANTTLAHRSRGQKCHDHKRAKHDDFGALAVRSKRQYPSAHEDEETSSGGLSDKPHHLTPPAGLSWQAAAEELPVRHQGPTAQTSAPTRQSAESCHDASIFTPSIVQPTHRPVGGRLPDDHPLKVHLARLQREREKRKLQWAGLIDSLGDEFRNPASHDRFLWLQEEQKADEVITETMLQIKMAESGLQPETTQPQSKQHDSGSTGAAYHGRGRGTPPGRGNISRGRDRRRGRYNRGRGRHDYQGRMGSPPLHMQDIHGRLHDNFRTRKANVPSRIPMRWDSHRKDDAVRSWLNEMGMSTTAGTERSVGDDDPAPLGRRASRGSNARQDDDAMSYISLGATGAGANNYDNEDDGRLMMDEENTAMHVYPPTLYGATAPRIGLGQGSGDEEEREFEAAEAAREQERCEAAEEMDRFGLGDQSTGLRVRDSESCRIPEGLLIDVGSVGDVNGSICVHGVDGIQFGMSPLIPPPQPATQLSPALAHISTNTGGISESYSTKAPLDLLTGDEDLPEIKEEPDDGPFGVGSLYVDLYGCDDGGNKVSNNNGVTQAPAFPLTGQQAQDEEDDEGGLMELEGSSDEDDMANLPLSQIPWFQEGASASAIETGEGANITMMTDGVTAEAEAMQQLAGIERLDLSAAEAITEEQLEDVDRLDLSGPEPFDANEVVEGQYNLVTQLLQAIESATQEEMYTGFTAISDTSDAEDVEQHANPHHEVANGHEDDADGIKKITSLENTHILPLHEQQPDESRDNGKHRQPGQHQQETDKPPDDVVRHTTEDASQTLNQCSNKQKQPKLNQEINSDNQSHCENESAKPSSPPSSSTRELAWETIPRALTASPPPIPPPSPT